MPITVRKAGIEELDAVADAFATAGADEAVAAWVMAGHPAIAAGYRADYVPRVVERALRDDEVWVAGEEDRIWAVSLWQHVTSEERVLAEAAEAREMAAAGPDVGPLRKLVYVTSLLAEHHPREFPHRYLQAIVTLPEHRGKGAGGAIVADRLKAYSDASETAFLEASTERSARLYARNGFARTGVTHTLPEDGPTLIPMWFRG
ncbi:GNAT family N-acetyltransferase [Nocardia puris]|uniref:GNAT family N-acetyltransferase n=1 Tax=Nocardia puris TaxID=208602 RepID=UPI00189519B6|nr:GNAT family N-acetyltransferase [Nocardia puris]MBF6213020.1 GNAT family N-acetyltransferase [Nocardia puris]MBF6368011.1 GNAT family N-acetyltransferase [Nocardia puris]MBF6462644.1 GNAT family N-acetyltransferase [Nocardia puris]